MSFICLCRQRSHFYHERVQDHNSLMFDMELEFDQPPCRSHVERILPRSGAASPTHAATDITLTQRPLLNDENELVFDMELE